MAYVYLDVCAFSQPWLMKAFKEDLAKSNNVKFLYSKHEKISAEYSKLIKINQFFQSLNRLNKVELINVKDIENSISNIQKNHEWNKNSGVCDDPHLFALAFNKPNPYIFSTDKRFASCRRCIKRKIHKKYTKFSLIMNEVIYLRLRKQILS